MKYLNWQKGISPIITVIIFAIFMTGAFYLGRSNNQNNNLGNSVIKNVPASVALFSSGKIAFLKKDGNVYVAEKSGKITQLTSDATVQISKTFDHSLLYRTPMWSPDGDKLVFEQVFSYADKASFLISDGKSIALGYNNRLNAYSRLPPFWYKNDRITVATKYLEGGYIGTSTLDGIKLTGTNGEDSPYFPKFNIATGCGGGGRPDWSYKLSWNHYGTMDGVRATLLYLKNERTLVYSTGCENQIVEKITPDGKISPFDIAEESLRELQLSPDRNILVGAINGNIVLYSTTGNLIKTLTNSGKAYGPVFSRDGKNIFYADNFGGKPILTKTSLDGTGSAALYNSEIVGAISNISPSSDDNQLIFTLIQQDKPVDLNKNIYPKAKENLYLINTDGSNLKLFLKDAYQGAWSPK